MTVINQTSGENWTMLHGDCCEVTKDIPDNSLDFCIHSPPFSSLYTYSDSESDMGNCASDEEFFVHYGYLIRELYRTMVPGRLVAVHCKDLPKYANRDGASGLTDFPGDIVRAYEAAGFTFHSRVTIWKCPVLERERTNNNGLLHKTVCRDRSQIRQGMADYVLVFRKTPSGTLMSDKPIVNIHKHSELNGDGELVEVVEHRGFDRYVGEVDPRVRDEHPSKYARTGSDGRDSIVIWRRYAEPVWWDIDQTDVLNFKLARDESDERHICPLQLGVIERCVELWSMPGEVVFSPFAGIGSEGYGAIRAGRKFLGIELKEGYFKHAIGNLRVADEQARHARRSLFDNLRDDVEDTPTPETKSVEPYTTDDNEDELLADRFSESDGDL